LVLIQPLASEDSIYLRATAGVDQAIIEVSL
jgi:hypothetical protein